MKTLQLFNCVTAKPKGEYKILPEYGIVIEPSASHAVTAIKKFLDSQRLNGQQLNQTFHKSWKVIKESSREELMIHQILHYLTTYGTDFQSSFVYTPDEDLDVPQVTTRFSVIRGLEKEQIIEKALDLLKSGVALKKETILDIIEVLTDLNYVFTGKEVIKNKEALMIICEMLGNVPSDPSEFVRYLIYTATEDTLIIKNKNMYDKIKQMDITKKKKVEGILAKCDAGSLAEVFNRFKPILLTFKKTLGKKSASIINKVSRLSKKLHVPMEQNILNNISSCDVNELLAQKDNLIKNANFFQLAKCIQFLAQSKNSDCKVYNIRNGKSWVKEKVTKTDWSFDRKIVILQDIISEKFSSELKGKKIYIPEGVYYSLPTSEKMFVGNVPMGSMFVSKEPIAMGVYWENSGGARDLDLSSVANTKVGWNSRYTYGDGDVMFSGDMTDARNGATEYIRVKKADDDYLILNNVFSGVEKGSVFDIIIGKGSNIDKFYMMDPNKVWFTTKTETIQKQTVVGMITNYGKYNAAIVLNFASGSSQVSRSGGNNDIMRKALIQRWKNCYRLNDVLEYCGANLVDSPENCDVDLTPSNLERDTILNLFKN